MKIVVVIPFSIFESVEFLYSDFRQKYLVDLTDLALTRGWEPPKEIAKVFDKDRKT